MGLVTFRRPIPIPLNSIFREADSGFADSLDMYAWINAEVLHYLSADQDFPACGPRVFGRLPYESQLMKHWCICIIVYTFSVGMKIIFGNRTLRKAVLELKDVWISINTEWMCTIVPKLDRYTSVRDPPYVSRYAVIYYGYISAEPLATSVDVIEEFARLT